jgi:NTE family protein
MEHEPDGEAPRRCLVLGGGGLAGIAWEIGVVAGLARCGVRLADADLFVGTSAGSVVGTQLASGLDVEQLLDGQLSAPADSVERFRPYSQIAADRQNVVLMRKVDNDLTRARQRIGAFALRSATPSLLERRQIIASRLPSGAWPSRRLKVVSVDVVTGMPRVFDAGSGVELVDAIAASCAVPGAWPAVPIGDATYMDGGIHSMTNVWVAAGAARVVVLAPLGFSDGNPVSGHLRAEVRQLRESGSVVDVIVPDAASQDAIGDNVLDPERRAPSASAGLRQASRLADSMKSY